MLIVLILLTGCGQTEQVVSLSAYDHKKVYLASEMEFLTAEESPIKLERTAMPDFGTYSIKCVTADTYSPQAPELEFHQQTTGNIFCYTVYKEIAYFVVSFDDYHEFSHIVKLFAYDLNSGSVKVIYTFEADSSSIYVSDIYVNDTDICFIELKDGDADIYYVENIHTDTNTSETAYKTDKSIMFFQDSAVPSWYELSDHNALIKYCDNSKITNGVEYYGFRRSLPYESSKLSYGMSMNSSECVSININENNKALRIDTDYKFLDLRYASEDSTLWLEWKAENDYSEPCLYCYDFDNDMLYNFPISRMGVFFSDCCIDGKYFLHLVRDNIFGKNNDFIENVYYIDMKNRKAYNLTENTVGKNDSLVRVEYEYLHSKNNCLYFYSRYNSNEESAEYKYQYLYRCEV